MGKAKDQELFADLTVEELRTLGDMLYSGGRAVWPDLFRGYEVGMEILDTALGVHNLARSREEAEAGQPRPMVESEPEATRDEPEIGN